MKNIWKNLQSKTLGLKNIFSTQSKENDVENEIPANTNRESLKKTLVDFLLGRAIEKLEPVADKPGLYRIPKIEFNVPFLGKQTLDLGENFAFKPKEGNALIINKGNQLDTFLLTHKGYCFLHELFPIEYGKVWDHEKNKWWVVQIPNSPERVDKIIEFLKKMTGTKNGDLSFLNNDDITYLKNNVGTEQFSDHVYDILGDALLEEVYEKTGYLIFQGATFQKSPGFREIIFSQFDEQSISTSGLPVRHRKELSPYYRVSFFPYAFIIPEAEDANNIPTRIALTIKAQCVNPYIAHVTSGDPYAQFSSTVINAGTEVVRGNFVHDISRKIILANSNSSEDLKVKASLNIIDLIQLSIFNQLVGAEYSESTFFGFDFGYTNDHREIVQIIDIDIVGPLATEMKTQVAKNYQSENQRDIDLANSVNNIEIAKNNAESKFVDKIAEAKAIKEAVIEIYGSYSPENMQKYYEEYIKPKQKQDQIAAYTPGGVNINNANDIIKNILNN